MKYFENIERNVDRRSFLKLVGATTASAFIPSAFSAEVSAKSPNFLIILIDDLGWGDIGLHDGRTPTPNIDRFFRQGVELNQFFACPLCSPTRAGLLTGINPLRISQGPHVDGVLDPHTMNFGRSFGESGYRTGAFGKWHNSVAPKFNSAMPSVNDYGFDRWVGFYGGAVDYYTKVWPNRNESPAWYHDGTPVNDERGYETDLLTKYAIDFMKENKDRFVCYLPYGSIHTPLHVKEEDLKRVPQEIVDAAGGLKTFKEYYVLWNKWEFGGRLQEAYVNMTGDKASDEMPGKLTKKDHDVLYSAMLINLDDNIGQLLDFLKKAEMEDNTVVWFASDNGAQTLFGSNTPLRGNKATLWDGGIRVPAAVRWPKGGLVGGRKYNGMVRHLDIYPTCMSMAGLDVPNIDSIDGENVYGAIKGNKISPVKEYYYVWELAGADALRTPQWKLLRYANKCELYDMINDEQEKHDVAGKNPDVVKNLVARMDSYTSANSIYPGHVPVNNVSSPPSKPVDNYLEYKITIDNGITGKVEPIALARIQPPKENVIPLHSKTSDRLEYDIYVAEDSATSGFVISPGWTGRPANMIFHSVDQNGQEYGKDYSYENAQGEWVRLSSGCAHLCPFAYHMFPYNVFLTAETPRHLHFYIANIRVVRKDGTDIVYPLPEYKEPKVISGEQYKAQVRSVSLG